MTEDEKTKKGHPLVFAADSTDDVSFALLHPSFS